MTIYRKMCTGDMQTTGYPGTLAPADRGPGSNTRGQLYLLTTWLGVTPHLSFWYTPGQVVLGCLCLPKDLTPSHRKTLDTTTLPSSDWLD